MATARPMYHVKPVYHDNAVQELPECMYKLKNICAATDSLGASGENETQALLARQDAIIAKLESLKERVDSLSAATAPLPASVLSSSGDGKPALPIDLVIRCHPSVPARAALSLLDKLTTRYNGLCTVHTHSSVRDRPCLELTKMGFLSNLVGIRRGGRNLIVTWIWQDCQECEMLVSPIRQTKIVGEANICRYLQRVLGEFPTDPVDATKLDHWLDIATCIGASAGTDKPGALTSLVKQLSKSHYLAGTNIGLADIVNCSAFIRSVTSGKWANDAKLKSWCSSVAKQFKL